MTNDISILSYIVLFVLIVSPIVLALYTAVHRSKELSFLRDNETNSYYIDLFYSIYKSARWEKVAEGVYFTKVVSPYATYTVYVTLFSKNIKVCVNPDDPTEPCAEDAYVLDNPEILNYFKHLYLETEDLGCIRNTQ